MTSNTSPVPVMKLQETHEEARLEPSDGMAILRIWSLLTDGAGFRDLAIGNRKIQ